MLLVHNSKLCVYQTTNTYFKKGVLIIILVIKTRRQSPLAENPFRMIHILEYGQIPDVKNLSFVVSLPEALLSHGFIMAVNNFAVYVHIPGEIVLQYFHNNKT